MFSPGATRQPEEMVNMTRGESSAGPVGSPKKRTPAVEDLLPAPWTQGAEDC